jgi:hypothetical protein
MSFKLPSIASFFSRAPHKNEDEKKSSASQFVTVSSHKTEKSDSKESGSKISRFFHRLFHSKEKAREGIETAFQKSKAPNPVSTHVQAIKINKTALVDIDDVANRTGAPKYFAMLDEITTVSANPETELNRRHEFIDSNEGRFMIDITNMGSCVESPRKHFRAKTGLDLQKTLTDAFQIYYEEGMFVNKNSIATPFWESKTTAQSLDDLKSLSATLQQITPLSDADRALLQKANRSIVGRIYRVVSGQQ